jgi:plastocyanin/heme-degrading monooxygenase HmoA
MEYVQTVLVQIAASKLNEALDPQGLIGELEAHRAIASSRPGFRGMQMTRSAGVEGDALVVIETRWANNNALADYASESPNIASIIESHSDEIVPNTLQVHRMHGPTTAVSEAPHVYDRLALALFVPLGVLAFALLVIYGLSRIYLALPDAAATPLAAGIALGVLGVAGYFATHPSVPRWQIAGVFVAVLGTLAIGGTAAAVYDSGHHTVKSPEAFVTPAPAAGGTPAGTPAANSVEITAHNIAFDKTTLTANAGNVTILFHNTDSAIPHNFAVYRSDSGPTDEIKHTDIAAGPVDQTLALTLEKGTYFFDCQVHPAQMFGKLVVQ